MRFSPEFINRVREANNLVDVIGQSVQLKRSGARLVGLCPFHGEKTPSFSVSEDKQMYHCFGCKASGNVFHFLQNFRGYSFPEAVEYLAQRAAISLPTEVYDGPSAAAVNEERERQKMLWRVNTYATHFYQHHLKKLASDHPVHLYLKKRGLKEETIERFELGYAPDGWTALADSIQGKNIPFDFPVHLGLIKKRNTEGYFDLFRHRLMFPIKSPMGQHIGFGGRVLGDEMPKYLNSPDSSVFHKGKVFYGLDETAKFIRSQDCAIVVEGYMDFLALYQAGIQNVIATLGTAFTNDHAKLIKRYTKNITVLFDGDRAGRDAAERSLPILLTEGLHPKGVVLAEGLDPDEFVLKYGVDALRKILTEAPELFTQLMQERFMQMGSGASDRVRLLDEIIPLLLNIADLRLRDIYSQWLCDLFGTEKQWAKNQLLKAFRGHQAPKPAVSEKVSESMQPIENIDEFRPPIVLVNPPRVELELLNVALIKPEYFEAVVLANIFSELESQSIREIFLRAQDLYRQMPNKFDSLTALLASEVKPPSAVTLHLAKPLSELQPGGAQKLIADCIRKIRGNQLRVKSRELAAHLKGQSPTAQLEKLEQIMNIHRDRHSLERETET